MATLSHAALSHLTGRGVRIAIIDSGVHAEHPHVGRIAGGIAFDDHGKAHGDFIDRLGHGTAVAAAIHEKAADAELYAVKVFDRSLATSARILTQAIDWAAEQRMALVNLSLGTPNPGRAQMLAEAVARATEAGTVVVSAARHEGTRWYPGSLPGVVAVELDWHCPRDAIRVFDGRLYASGYPRPIPGVPPARNLRGISFAVANATALLALALQHAPETRTAEDALGALESAARP